MSKSIIQVTNLSKSYTINHEGKERYTALRDVMAQKAKKIFSFPKSLRPNSTVTHEEFWALKDINFEIEQGDRVGIIGRNGAGKSTLLKILSRITEPTSGEIKIKGRVASLLEVGTGFHPELTGRENIFLNGAILGMSRTEIKKHFDAIIDFAEVEKFLDTPVKRYSSGMYVRLAFAVAAHLEPEILVVDEVLAVGDAGFQKKCLGKMEDVSKNGGRTVIFVSHNIAAIRTLTTQAIYLQSGIVKNMGFTNDVIADYLSDNISLVTEKNDITQFRRNNKNLIASIKSISIGKKRNNFSKIELLEEIEIEIEIDCSKETLTTIVNLIIKNSEGDFICTISSLDKEKEFNLVKGKNIITVMIDKNLFTPGKYFAIIGIGPSAQETAYDVLLDYPLFESFNSDVIKNWLDRPFGSFHISDIKWKF